VNEISLSVGAKLQRERWCGARLAVDVAAVGWVVADALRAGLGGGCERFLTMIVLDSFSSGVVYQATVIESGDEAKSLRTGESVAIKKVLQDRRFKNRELQIMSMLNHPNLIGLRHCFYSKGDPSSAKDADSLYLNLVMKFVPSTIHRTLRDHAKANRLVPMFLTRLYVWQMCRAVHYIHTIGVCHRG
jgi:glycogen synthase kinase 3 beta